MGFPSCLENDAERAYDRLFMAGLVQPIFQTPSLIVGHPQQLMSRATPVANVINPDVHTKHVRALRDIHVLCLAELRPRATAH